MAVAPRRRGAGAGLACEGGGAALARKWCGCLTMAARRRKATAGGGDAFATDGASRGGRKGPRGKPVTESFSSVGQRERNVRTEISSPPLEGKRERRRMEKKDKLYN
ncbi:hypothetical protein U1Q18_040931 [Sarracenia purpurea var. burkii]